MLQRYGRLKLTSCLSIDLQVQVQVQVQVVGGDSLTEALYVLQLISNGHHYLHHPELQ